MNLKTYINLLEYIITVLLFVGGTALIATIIYFFILVCDWRPENKIRWR